MATNIAKLNVMLTASTEQFQARMLSASRTVSGFSGTFNRATDSARAFKSLAGSFGEFKLAGRETIGALQTTFAVARSELRRFARNKDVQVALEIGREHLHESWLRARSMLMRAVERSGIKVAASIVSDRSQSAVAWIQQQRRRLVKPIAVRVLLARQGFDSALVNVQTRLNGLRRFRAVRIGIAAANGLRLPVQAAMASLGPLTKLAGKGLIVGLKAVHFGFAAGITTARKMLGGLLSMGSSVVSSLVGGFAKAGLAVAAIGAIGAYALARLVSSSMESIDGVAKLSDRLGVTTEGLTGLKHAAGIAGVSNEQLTGSLEKMLKNLAEAADGGGTAAGALRQMGLDAKSMANAAPENAFKQIADGLKGITNPAQRAQAAMDIFGRSGQSLLPLMMSGAEGIAAAQKEAEKLGLTYSRVDAAKVEQANDAITRSKAVFEGVSNQIAIGLAPYIEAAAAKFTELATAGGGIGPKVGGALEWVATAVATAADYLKLLQAGFKLLQSGATYAVFGIVKAIDFVGGGLVKLLNMLPGVSLQWTTFTGQLADGLLEDARRLGVEAGQAFDGFQRGDSAKAVARTFADIRDKSEQAAKQTAANADQMKGAFEDLGDDGSKALQKVADSLAEIKKDSEQFGLSDSQKKLADLQANNAAPDQMAQAKQLLAVKDQLEAVSKISTDDPLADLAAKMERLQQLYAQGLVTAQQFGAIRDTAKQAMNDKLNEQAKSITDSVKTPLEQYQAELEKLNTLFEQGLITKETFDRAVLKAKPGLETPEPKAEAPELFKAGSAQAAKLVYELGRGQQKLSKDELAKRQYAESQQTNKLLEQVAKNTRTSTSDTTVMDI